MNTKRLAGNVRTLFLIIIAEQGPIYGLEVAREYQARTGSPKALNAGTLYPNLRRLEQLGWVSVEEKDPPRGRIPVSYYTITDAGRQALPSEVAEATSTLRTALRILGGYKPQWMLWRRLA